MDNAASGQEANTWLKVGYISGVFGVKGWVKVFANTEQKENILALTPWFIKSQNVSQQPLQETKVKQGKLHGKTIIAQLEGIDDRNQAETKVGSEIFIRKDQLPDLDEDQFYWSDLLGLNVVSTSGERFGKIKQMLETGANDVMVVKGNGEDRLIPFVFGPIVKSVDLDAEQLIVDWDSDF